MQKLIIVFFSLTVCLFMASPVLAQNYYPFPDTGQTKCYDNEKEIVCPQPGQPFYGQDAQYQPRIPRSYTKLGHGGIELPDNARHEDEGGNWIMTRDNVTGLIWEIKTKANMNNTYDWGQAQNIFIAQLNSQGFGGFSDWRLPNERELLSLAYYGRYLPAIVLEWFPNTIKTRPAGYWTSINRRVNFDFGMSQGGGGSHYVRAVREGQTFDQPLIDNGDGTLTDPNTGLMWQKATAPGSYNWEQALAYAENLNLSGHSDWRLPNIGELKTTWNNFNQPFSEFETINGNYWSSTPSSADQERVFQVWAGDGAVHYGTTKTGGAFLRVVRSANMDDFSVLQKSNIIFNWLESLFPSILSPSPQPTHVTDNIYFRYYPGTNVYLGVMDNDLYYYDEWGVLHNLGPIDIWLALAQGEGTKELIGFGPIRISETWVEHAHWDPYYVGMCHTFVSKTEAKIQYKYMSSPVTINYDTGSKPPGYQDIHPAVQGLPQLWFRTAGNRPNEGDQMAVFKEQVTDNHIEVHRVWYYSDGTIDDEDEPSGQYRRYWLRMDCPH